MRTRWCVLQNNLYILRMKKRWTQKYVAEKLNVTPKTIKYLESNNYSPPLILAIEISILFEISIKDMFMYEIIKCEENC